MVLFSTVATKSQLVVAYLVRGSKVKTRVYCTIAVMQLFFFIVQPKLKTGSVQQHNENLEAEG